MKLSIIIVAYKAEDYLKRCLESIPKSKQWEVIVIDNSVINRGFAKGCNLGAKQAKGKYLLFLNPDTEVVKGSLETMIKIMDTHPEIGILGPKLIDETGHEYPSYSLQPTAQAVPIVYSIFNRLNLGISKRHWMHSISKNTLTEVGVISGAALLIRTDDFKKLQGFDERFFMYWEETDLCRRLLANGKKIVFAPQAVIMHASGKTTAQVPQKTLGWFRDSRFWFFRKHFGLLRALLYETILVTLEEWRLLLILAWAAFLRFYQLPELMPLLGDQARDFLAASEMISSGNVPLLGIESSMPRFSQGPVYVWLLGLLFLIFGNNPVVAGYFAAATGLLTVGLIYVLIRQFLGQRPAVLSALLLATSPLAVTQSRLAFMTSPIPLLVLIFLWRLTKPNSQRNLFLLALSFGLLFQFELASFPLVLLLLARLLWPTRYLLRSKITWGTLIAGLGLGLLPQIIYDSTHRFAQLGMFVAWVGYRIGGFVGFDQEHTATPARLFQAIALLWEYWIRFIAWGYPPIAYGALTILIVSLIALLKTKSKSEVLIWSAAAITVLIVAYTVHGAPSEAYFPAFFVPVIMLMGWLLSRQKWAFTLGLLGIVGLGVFQSWFLVQHDFLVGSRTLGVTPAASYGAPLRVYEELTNFIESKTPEKKVEVQTVGPGSEFVHFSDNIVYLLKLRGYSFGSNGVPVYVGQGVQLSDFPVDNLVYTVHGVSVGVPLP